MADTLKKAYDHALGRCLQAMIDLRRVDGNSAISELKDAIRTIEDGQRRATREHHLEVSRNRAAMIEPAPIPPYQPQQF